MELISKRVNSKLMKVTLDGAYGAYQFGKWWLVKDLKSKRVVHKANTLTEVKEYLIVKEGK